jgi:hypothetical protein
MAVDEDGMPEELGRSAHEVAKGAVLGLVEPLDPMQGLVHGQA